MMLDERGRSKGFAFVEFENQASNTSRRAGNHTHAQAQSGAMAALAANNTELKKRRIAVTLSDPRAPTRKCALLRKPSPVRG